MTQKREPGSAEATYRYLHLSEEQVAQLPPGELLQACLELHRLLTIVKGVLYTHDSTLILRAVTIDLLLQESERLARESGEGASAAVTYDMKVVSDRLGIRPVSVRQAYEQLHELGGVNILARQFPRGRIKQQHLPLEDTGTTKDTDGTA